MMKYLIILLLFPLCVSGQSTYKILADTTRLGSINATGNELAIENDTRDSTGGVLVNVLNGRTNFQKLRIQKLTDTTYRLILGTTQQGQTITFNSSGNHVDVDSSWLFLNAGRDSICLNTVISGVTYRTCVRDSVGAGAFDTTTLNYYTVIATQNAPPGVPATGATYTVGTSPSGAWVGNANAIAEWDGAAWQYTTPVQGDYYYDQTSGYTYQFRSGAWVRTSSIPVLVNGQNLSAGVRLGTNNARSLSLETNNVIRFRVDSIGVLHSYYTPVASDTDVVMISPTGKITKQGKSTLLAGLGGVSSNYVTADLMLAGDSARNHVFQGNVIVRKTTNPTLNLQWVAMKASTLNFINTTGQNFIDGNLKYITSQVSIDTITGDLRNEQIVGSYDNSINKKGFYLKWDTAGSSQAFFESLRTDASYGRVYIDNVDNLLHINHEQLYGGTNVLSVDGNTTQGLLNVTATDDVEMDLTNGELNVIGLTQDNTTPDLLGLDASNNVKKVDVSTIVTDSQSLHLAYSDSIRLSITRGNYVAFAYAIDSVGQTANADSMIVYKAGTRYAYVNGTFVFSLNAGGDSLVTIHNGTRTAVKPPGGSSGWGLTGNAVATDSTNYIGTTNAEPLQFYTNGVLAMKLDENKRLIINKTNGIAQLDVKSAVTNFSYKPIANFESVATNVKSSIFNYPADSTVYVGLNTYPVGDVWTASNAVGSYIYSNRLGLYFGTNNGNSIGGTYTQNTSKMMFCNAANGSWNINTGGVDYTYPLTVQKSYNGREVICSINGDGGASAAAGYFTFNGTNFNYISHFGSGHTQTALRHALVLDGTNANGVALHASAASGLIRFYTSGYTERARFDANGSFGINTGASNNASAIFQVVSTTKGSLPFPVMTTAQRDAISSPMTGLTIFCSDCTATDSSTGVTQTYNGTGWKNYW